MKNLLIVIFIFSFFAVHAQNPIGGIESRLRNLRSSSGSGADSLGKRNKHEDSITISYKYLDTTHSYKLDSSINDFTKRFPIPAHHYYLGNTGNPTQSYLFSPIMKSGWDAGFHALDVYKFTLEKARFFTTTRQYSEINYMLASKAEQYINLLHTQNIRPNWNAHFEYRLITAPGIYKNQKTSHNNYLLTNWIHSANKRYNNYFILVANKLQNTENGGIKDDGKNYLDDPLFSERFRIPTNIGGDALYDFKFLNTNIKSGNKYSDFNVLMRQQYDFGRKDSLVTDSTIIPLFFPRIRMEHTFQYSKYNFIYLDDAPDASYYDRIYKLALSSNGGELLKQDRWRELVNDFSIYTFPDANNTQQYIKVGAAVQNLTGYFDSTTTKNYYNIFGHGEYRNRTKNKKWDLMANGKLYFTGINAGDYEAGAQIQSLLGKKIGSLSLGFKNTNRTPSFISGNAVSDFYLMPQAINLKKENITQLYANIYQPLLKLGLTGRYYLVNNYVYYTDYYKVNQATALFNVLQIDFNKVFEAGRNKQWKWRADVYFQQVVGNAPMHVPTIFTRNRFAYEGNLGYRNLTLAAGFEVKYRTNYKANGYSPVLGQFYFQDSAIVKYKLPDIAAYINFRIQSFKLFFSAENLNTFRKLGTNWGFTNNNLATIGYPYPGLLLRLGVFWGFVN